MSQTIQIKRGTQALILSGSMSIGEFAVSTDTKNVFWFDGVGKNLVGKVTLDTFANRPAFGVSGRFFYATDNSTLYLDTATAWTTIGGGSSGSSVLSRRATLTYNTASPLNIGAVVPINAIVTKAIINVDIVFNGASPTLSLGVTGNVSNIAPASSIKLKQLGTYIINSFLLATTPIQVIGTFVSSGSTVGSATILLEYHTA